MGAVVGGATYGATSGAAFGGAVGMLFERYGIRENAAKIYGFNGFITGGIVGVVKVREQQRPKPIDHEYDPTEL